MPRWAIRARVQFEGGAHVMEDTCGFLGPAAWVIDGATSLLEPLGLPAESDPSWLAQTLSLELSRVQATQRNNESADDDGATAVRRLLATALARIDEQAQQLVGQERVRFPSAALSMALLTDTGVTLLSLADCHMVVRLRTGAVEHVMSLLADSAVEAQLEQREGPHESRPVDPAELRGYYIRDRERRNSPGHLWVARREPEAAEHALVVELGPPELLVMATDGAWRAVDLGLVDSPEAFLDAVSTPSGALQLMAALRRHQAVIGELADDATVMVLEATS